jgi:hypothetical protein
MKFGTFRWAFRVMMERCTKHDGVRYCVVLDEDNGDYAFAGDAEADDLIEGREGHLITVVCRLKLSELKAMQKAMIKQGELFR